MTTFYIPYLIFSSSFANFLYSFPQPSGTSVILENYKIITELMEEGIKIFSKCRELRINVHDLIPLHSFIGAQLNSIAKKSFFKVI